MKKELKRERQVHDFAPVYNENSKILILGTFPSVKSRENGFYYGHPQNRFWKVVSSILECPIPLTVEEKKEMLLTARIAIWDVIESCDIAGSSDSSITNVVPAKLERVLCHAHIRALYANGKTAEKLYKKYSEETYKRSITVLPSTSPANAAYSLERLVESWNVLKNPLTNGMAEHKLT